VDEPIEGAALSIWADPDVGVGTFYIYVDGEQEDYEIPPIHLAVHPLDIEGTEGASEATLPLKPKQVPYQRVAKADFDHRGPWRLRFVLDEASGAREIELDVEVTPPGLGRLDLAWFLSPFLAVGFLWAKVVLGKRRSPQPKTS
jgi:hypothetical protein